MAVRVRTAQCIRHSLLLQDTNRCGECGNRFCAVTLPMGRSYKCAGRTGVCSTRLPGYDSVECYRYLLEYKMALESAKYTESEIMKDLVENVSQLDKASHSFGEWKNAMDRHRSQMVAARMNKESIF